AESTWGSYYEHQPRVLAGNLQKGLERLRLVQERKRKQA
ncbi:thermostable hemolysin, partial [Vibrio sp. Vb0888]